MRKYPLPEVLKGKCSPEDYTHWLYNKAAAHVRRDTQRGNRIATAIIYRDAIHRAVCHGGDNDAYTGRPLRWDLIRKYDNEKSKVGKREYKKQFADLPTVDHVGDGMSNPDFKICSWRINDCKNDLTIEEFVEVCRDVLKHNPE
ncbi:MAG: hypothetical protein KKG09_04595 [Verrucomicrobia bacterium]|nr:hypothetical protein [Verrucomicrobiota bacterium]MBU4289450.1 hypothetical protein [Verrucomicrobiota bacterium]MBU4428720.1 hypothetical protein [Verrucomicrobiota bacterium]MBU4497264.1 hypothetical protein [Verrucomicrobiota bacterium]MCG2679157.1 hypothetical protein [Kiritimatiellia bacterium]